MAFTQADLDAINDAIAKGVTKVKYQDKEITYRTLAEMYSIRDDIAAGLGLKGRTCRVKARYNKGVDPC